MRISPAIALLAGVSFLCGVVATTAFAGPTPAQKCLAKKIKEAAKYDGCRLKAEAKAVIKGEPAELAGCGEKLTGKWDKLDESGDCDLIGDQPDLQSIADAHTDAVVDLLTNGPGATCGNGIVEGGEDCDSAELDGGTCTTQGFGGGTLACDGSCSFDTAACVVASCGNGTIELGEQCDGADLNNRTCTGLGFSNGVGALTCDGSCQYDSSTCMELCGNGAIDAVAFEQCDGVNLDGRDCTDFGANGGTLGCATGCFYDISGCSWTCGNNNQEGLEECDGTDLAGETCIDQGFVGGTLGCSACSFDTSSCIATCGDGIVSVGAGEGCDGMVAGPISSCGQLGYTSGTLGCTPGCQNDTSGCTVDCDVVAQDCAPGQGCYLEIFGGESGCVAEGSGGENDFCQAQSDCQAGHICSTSDGVTGYCLLVCDYSMGNADCAPDQECFGGPALFTGQPDLGVCIPMF